MGKLTKAERVKRNQERRLKNKQAFNDDIKLLKSFCGIGGNYSALELAVVTSAKLGLTVRGDVHPHTQIKVLAGKVRKLDDKPKFKCRTKKDFYSSRAWKILRYQAFERYGNKCACCGATPSDGLVMHVDHIKPKSTSPELALDIENLQILCEDCNVGKINQWQTDWRP
jgi:ribosomal protein S30